MELIWDLRDDPARWRTLLPGPALGDGLGGALGSLPPAGAGGPLAGSPEWWEAVEAALDEEPIRGVIEQVDLKKQRFEMQTEDGQKLTGFCRGGTDHYFEGWEMSCVFSYPPTGLRPAPEPPRGRGAARGDLGRGLGRAS